MSNNTTTATTVEFDVEAWEIWNDRMAEIPSRRDLTDTIAEEVANLDIYCVDTHAQAEWLECEFDAIIDRVIKGEDTKAIEADINAQLAAL